jgi:2OG-Fe(II) oxygenase superfamily
MSNSAPMDWIVNAIRNATKSDDSYMAYGSLPELNPGLVVEGYGPVAFPLQPGAAKSIKAAGQIAPYGLGTKTLVDTKVRNTIEIDPSRFHLSHAWNEAIQEITKNASKQLGLDTDQLEAKIYKLLIYEKGGFFLPHRDSEKLDRMVASMIVVLPNFFQGGDLHIRHKGDDKPIRFSRAARGERAEFVAFYADCEHEVMKVTGGHRVCLAYNLVLKKQNTPLPNKRPTSPSPLLEPIKEWINKSPAKPLVFALEHHYTQSGLSLELLKGADRELADLVIRGATEAGCEINFTQVEWHPTYVAFSDDDDFGDGYRSRRNRASRKPNPNPEYDIQELIDEDFSGSDWVDLQGNKQPWGSIELDPSALVTHIPIDDWVPTKQDYEGYTGNEGNTLDRWYHRTALVIWHRSRHFEILASHGIDNVLPIFVMMVSELPKTPKAKREEARKDCVSLTRGILSEWPVRWSSWASEGIDKHKDRDDFPKHLLKLSEPSLNKLFLEKLALHDEVTPLESYILSIGREHGWSTYTQELKAFFEPRKELRYARRMEIPPRDAGWLLALCLEQTAEEEQRNLVVELCQTATEFFLEQDFRDRFSRSERERSTAERVLPMLVQALLAAKLDDLATKLITAVLQRPAEFTTEDGHMPALQELVPWCKKKFGKLPKPVTQWLAAVRDQLKMATKSAPQPPTDWTRPNTMTCDCASCQKLKAYLADASQEQSEIPGLVSDLEHLQSMIKRDRLDATSTISRATRPFRLKLTKTTSSHKQALKRHALDQKLLKALPTE